jgi:hypothetical protein
MIVLGIWWAFPGVCFCQVLGEEFGEATTDFPLGPTKKATASAAAQWPVDGLHPTLRDEAAKDGAPVWFW